ncbi:hypothetical protein LY78DRAFT_686603 [Colletotrichum sublineola]|nr:hypothetical protein LY78DRAFT_686603 [Colletotrichum sublineola]
MSKSAYTLVLYGNDATGKSTLAPAPRATGEVVYARGDEDLTLEDTFIVRTFDKLTIVRIILDAELPVFQARLASRPSTDKWESEKSLFYFRERFLRGKQATAEIAGLSAIRATGSRLFLEMLHHAGFSHTYEGLHAHGLIWAHRIEITQIETVYKELCAGTDKHSFYGMVTDPNVTLPTGQYKRGSYVRFDWRNPNHTYKGINPATHSFYHLKEASAGKGVFYDNHLTTRAKPFGDQCVPEELVHSV